MAILGGRHGAATRGHVRTTGQSSTSLAKKIPVDPDFDSNWARAALWAELLAFFGLLAFAITYSQIWRKAPSFFASEAVSNALRDSFFGPNAEQTIMTTWRPYHFCNFVTSLLLPVAFGSYDTNKRVWAQSMELRFRQVRGPPNNDGRYRLVTGSEVEQVFGNSDQFDYFPSNCFNAVQHSGARGTYNGGGGVVYMKRNSSCYEFRVAYRDEVPGYSNGSYPAGCAPASAGPLPTTRVAPVVGCDHSNMLNAATTFFNQLSSGGWVDNQTTAIFLDFLLEDMWTNSALQSAGVASMHYLGLWEFTPNRGVMFWDRLNNLTTPPQMVQQPIIILANVYFGLWVAYQFCMGLKFVLGVRRDVKREIWLAKEDPLNPQELSKRQKLGLTLRLLVRPFSSDLWPVVDVFIFILLCLCMAYSAVISLTNFTVTVDLFGQFEPQNFISVQVAGRRVVGLLILGLCIKAIQFLARWFPRINMLVWVLMYSGKDAAYFCVVFALAVVGAGGMFNIIQGSLQPYNTVSNSIFSMMRALFGDFDIPSLEHMGEKQYLGPNFFGPFLLLVFMFVAVFILLSMFVSIISDSWATASHDLAFVETWDAYQSQLGLTDDEIADELYHFARRDELHQRQHENADLMEETVAVEESDRLQRVSRVMGVMARSKAVDVWGDLKRLRGGIAWCVKALTSNATDREAEAGRREAQAKELEMTRKESMSFALGRMSMVAAEDGSEDESDSEITALHKKLDDAVAASEGALRQSTADALQGVTAEPSVGEEGKGAEAGEGDVVSEEKGEVTKAQYSPIATKLPGNVVMAGSNCSSQLSAVSADAFKALTTQVEDNEVAMMRIQEKLDTLVRTLVEPRVLTWPSTIDEAVQGLLSKKLDEFKVQQVEAGQKRDN